MDNKIKKQLEKLYLGKFVKINHLKDEDNKYDGRSGQVEFIDDKGLLHGTWGGLAIIPDVDDFDVKHQVAENEQSDEEQLNEDGSNNNATTEKEPKAEDFNDPYSVTFPVVKNIEQIVKGCACKVKNGKAKTQIIAKDFKEVVKIIEKLVKSNIFKQTLIGDNTQGLTINKISKSSLNDSINEGEIPTDRYSGKFQTEYIFAEDDTDRLDDTKFDFDEDGNVVASRVKYKDRGRIEYNAAKNHVKYMTNRGIKVDIAQGRYSTKLYITYEGKEQYDIFKRWLAWHLGYTDVVANVSTKKDEKEIDQMIARGSSNMMFN